MIVDVTIWGPFQIGSTRFFITVTGTLTSDWLMTAGKSGVFLIKRVRTLVVFATGFPSISSIF